MHIYRWDLDKTYLDTDIESVRGLIRTALESARDKQTIPGAAELIRQLRLTDSNARVHFLSGSPKQMRPVIQEKLRLDGVEVDRLTLKDNLGNIRRGRLRDVRGQLGYKLTHLLEQRVGMGASVRETLFGDDSEVDALVYKIYAEVLRGSISSEDVSRIMQAGGAYSDSIDRALEAADKIARTSAVDQIFIHIAKGVPCARFRLLGDLVTPVFSWIQASLSLHQGGRLPLDATLQVIDSCVRTEPLAQSELLGIFQDAVRRGLIAFSTLSELSQKGLPDLSLQRIKTCSVEPVRGAITRTRPDYLGFLRACQHTPTS